MATSTIKSDLLYENYTIPLDSQSWTQSSTGKYYAVTSLYSSSGKITYSCTITNFNALRATDVVTPYVSSGTGKLNVMSNTNSFSSGASIDIRIAYKLT